VPVKSDPCLSVTALMTVLTGKNTPIKPRPIPELQIVRPIIRILLSVAEAVLQKVLKPPVVSVLQKEVLAVPLVKA